MLAFVALLPLFSAEVSEDLKIIVRLSYKHRILSKCQKNILLKKYLKRNLLKKCKICPEKI